MSGFLCQIFNHDKNITGTNEFRTGTYPQKYLVVMLLPTTRHKYTQNNYRIDAHRIE